MLLPQRVTTNHAADEQLLYFTSSSLTSNDSELFFISNRTGNPNIFVRNLYSGEEIRLTSNNEGYLKSYVYFDGNPYRGLGKASISLHSQSGTVYYIQGVEIRKIDARGNETTLARYPHGQMTAFTHVSADGKLLCVPTTDARALDGDDKLAGQPAYDIDERVRSERLYSYLRVYDTDTGKEVMCEQRAGCWITHVQFSPLDSGIILYNHEWPSDCGIRRMWLWDGKKHRPLRTEGQGRSRNDWTCHEMWERDGSAIIYHGTFADDKPYIGRVKPDGTAVKEIPLPTGCRRYGHFTTGTPGVLVTDGYYEEEGDRHKWGSDWISRVDVHWDAGELNWQPLCRNLSSWNSQDEHPHPIFDTLMGFVYFTSDADGRRAIYRMGSGRLS